MTGGTTISLDHRPGDDPAAGLHAALVAVHDYAEAQALDAGRAVRLAIVAEELLANLFDHAPDGFVANLTLEQDGTRIRLILEDSAPSFDPRSASDVTGPNAERGGGVGLALVLAWSEVEDYSAGEIGGGRLNRLVLSLSGSGP